MTSQENKTLGKFKRHCDAGPCCRRYGTYTGIMSKFVRIGVCRKERGRV